MPGWGGAEGVVALCESDNQDTMVSKGGRDEVSEVGKLTA